MSSIRKRIAAGLLLIFAAMAANAQAPERPIYLDVQPVAGAGPDILSEQTVVAMAREAISRAGAAVIRLGDQDLPPNVRIVRILYIVHDQQDDSGTVIAASASTELLRTWGEGRVQHTYSVYNGMQQSLAQSADAGKAEADIVRLFKQELQERIARALAPRAQDAARRE